MAYQVNFSKGMLFYKDCCPNSFEVHRDSPGAIFSFYMYHEERQIYEKNTVIGKNITSNDLGIFIFFFQSICTTQYIVFLWMKIRCKT